MPISPTTRRMTLLQCVALIGGLDAVQHLAEDDSAHAVQFAAELQLHEHAVDLVGLGVDVLEEEDLVPGLDFIRRAQRGHQNGEASAIELALGAAGHQRDQILARFDPRNRAATRRRR